MEVFQTASNDSDVQIMKLRQSQDQKPVETAIDNIVVSDVIAMKEQPAEALMELNKEIKETHAGLE